MSWIIFKNAGEINPMAITTFGISAKVGDSPIGYFGTGLKYAVSILLRSKHELIIYSGREELRFGLKSSEMRGKEFDVATMNGQDLPFTTELGKNWETWQAFREIYCNCIDEGGEVDIVDEIPVPVDGYTHIVVKGPEFERIFHARDQIVLNKNLPELVNCKSGIIYNVPSRHIYYRGVRVFDIRPSQFTYNITAEMMLTEDRTVRSEWDITYHTGRMIARLEDKRAIAKVLYSEKDFFERELSISSSLDRKDMSDQFFNAIEKGFQMNRDNLNSSALSWIKNYLNKNSFKNYTPAGMTNVEKRMLERCVAICANMYPDFKDYPIQVVKTLGESTMAYADRELDQIIISKRCFTLGTKFLFSTLLEEYFHLATGFNDLTRDLQTYLFDTISSLVENHVIEEPL